MLDRPILAVRHVRLEPLRLDDARDLWPAASERELWRYMLTDVAGEAGLEAWVRARVAAMDAGTALAFVQRDATTGQAFGSTSLFDVDLAHRRMEIGHTWVGASHRRTAANTESKLLLLRHAFETLRAERVQLKTDALNARSQAAIERLGARREGTLRALAIDSTGRVTDRVMYSIVRAEWPEVRARLEGSLAR